MQQAAVFQQTTGWPAKTARAPLGQIGRTVARGAARHDEEFLATPAHQVVALAEGLLQCSRICTSTASPAACPC